MIRKLSNKNIQRGQIFRNYGFSETNTRIVKEDLAAEREEKRNENAILISLIGQQQQMMTQLMAVFREIINKNN